MHNNFDAYVVNYLNTIDILGFCSYINIFGWPWEMDEEKVYCKWNNLAVTEREINSCSSPEFHTFNESHAELRYKKPLLYRTSFEKREKIFIYHKSSSEITSLVDDYLTWGNVVDRVHVRTFNEVFVYANTNIVIYLLSQVGRLVLNFDRLQSLFCLMVQCPQRVWPWPWLPHPTGHTLNRESLIFLALIQKVLRPSEFFFAFLHIISVSKFAHVIFLLIFLLIWRYLMNIITLLFAKSNTRRWLTFKYIICCLQATHTN